MPHPSGDEGLGVLYGDRGVFTVACFRSRRPPAIARPDSPICAVVPAVADAATLDRLRGTGNTLSFWSDALP